MYGIPTARPWTRTVQQLTVAVHICICLYTFTMFCNAYTVSVYYVCLNGKKWISQHHKTNNLFTVSVQTHLNSICYIYNDTFRFIPCHPPVHNWSLNIIFSVYLKTNCEPVDDPIKVEICRIYHIEFSFVGRYWFDFFRIFGKTSCICVYFRRVHKISKSDYQLRRVHLSLPPHETTFFCSHEILLNI